MASAVRRIPPALLVLLGAGVLLRLAMWMAYSPVVMSLRDSTTYIGLAQGDVFSSAVQSAGYPVFLRTLHAVTDQIEFTVAVQHLLGIATALVLFATVRRLGAPVWVGCIAAAAVLLSLDQVFLEHALMTETLFAFLLAAGAYCAVRALEEPSLRPRGPSTRILWIAAAGMLLGLTAHVRSYTVLLIPLLGLWLLLALPRPWKTRVTGAVAGVAAAGLVVLVYAGTQYAMADHFGLNRSGGWALYSRTAQFADCSKFTPPAGTRMLCEATPPAQRPGPDFYGWDPASPARRAFGGQPRGGEELTAFARAAILHQPLDYVSTVFNDTIRYFAPDWEIERPFAGTGYGLMDIDRRADIAEPLVSRKVNGWYAEEELRIRGGVDALNNLQHLLRVHPILLLQFLIAAVGGLIVARGRLRAAIALFAGASVCLLAIPPATAIYSARYAIPVDGLLAAAGALGGWALLTRFRREPEVVATRAERRGDAPAERAPAPSSLA